MSDSKHLSGKMASIWEVLCTFILLCTLTFPSLKKLGDTCSADSCNMSYPFEQKRNTVQASHIEWRRLPFEVRLDYNKLLLLSFEMLTYVARKSRSFVWRIEHFSERKSASCSFVFEILGQKAQTNHRRPEIGPFKLLTNRIEGFPPRDRSGSTGNSVRQDTKLTHWSL